mgnify:CR=1 FL=1
MPAPAERLFAGDESAEESRDESVGVSENVGVLAEPEEYGKGCRAAERREPAKQAVGFFGHEPEFNYREATDGGEYECRKTERAKVGLYRKRDANVCNRGRDGDKRRKP